MNVKIVATHDGTFHSDEVCAVALLLRLFPDATVVRTRHEELLEKADIRVDVGMKYEPPTDFDHHQPDFNLARDSGIPYSSCGLVALHFKDTLFPSEDVWYKLDRSMFSAIDGQDNGLEICKPVNGLVTYDISRIIASFRPTARSTRGKHPELISHIYDTAFDRAVSMASSLINREIERIDSWVLDQEIVERAVTASNGAPIVVLPHYAPWQEKVILTAPEAEIIVFPDERATSWVAQSVPDKIGGMSPPLFPASWSGKRGEELVNISGIESAVFCHKARFMCVARTKEGALEMADHAISA